MEEKSYIKYSIKKNCIYHGDSLSILKTIPSNSVDLVFADPPYNLQLKNKLLPVSYTHLTLPTIYSV